MSVLNIAHEIVVNFDVPEGAPTLDLLLSDVDALDKAQEGRAVKLFQFGVFADKLHLLLDIIGLLLVCLQFARQTLLLFQLLGAFGLVLVHKLDTDGLRGMRPITLSS